MNYFGEKLVTRGAVLHQSAETVLFFRIYVLFVLATTCWCDSSQWLENLPMVQNGPRVTSATFLVLIWNTL